MIKAKKPKPPTIHIHVFEEMYAPDDNNWWSVRSEYVGSGKGKTFEIGGVFSSKQRAIQFALDQAEHYRNMMDDHTFEVLLSDENGDEQRMNPLPSSRDKAADVKYLRDGGEVARLFGDCLDGPTDAANFECVRTWRKYVNDCALIAGVSSLTGAEAADVCEEIISIGEALSAPFSPRENPRRRAPSRRY